MKKTIDAVKTVRNIRDRLYRKTKNMSRQELIHFYRTEAERTHANLKHGKSGIFMKHIGESYKEVRKKLIGGDKKREARIKLEASKIDLLERRISLGKPSALK